MIKYALAAALLALPVSGSAATYLLTATASSTTLFEDFTIVFNDENEDLVLTLNEIDEFSGVQRGSVLYTAIQTLPTISVTAGVSNGPWRFTNPVPTTAQNPRAGALVAWSYEIALVPLPASALMLIGALGALGFARRRRAAV